MWEKHGESLLLFAATYLGSEYVVHTVSLNHPDNRVEMRACDYAAYVVQAMSGEDFGARPYKRSDEVVEKARAWVRDNMGHEEDGKAVLRAPEPLATDRMRRVTNSGSHNPRVQSDAAVEDADDADAQEENSVE